MKKVLSVLGLIAILGMTTPAMAGPHGPGGGPGGHGPHRGGHRIHAGAHHRPHMAPHHRHYHGGGMIHVGHHHPRHCHWHGHRVGYWGCPWCSYGLGGYYYPGVGVHVPMGAGSFSLHF